MIIIINYYCCVKVDPGRCDIMRSNCHVVVKLKVFMKRNFGL